VPQARFEPAIPGSDQPKTLALDHPATGIGIIHYWDDKIKKDEVGWPCGTHGREMHIGLRWKPLKNIQLERFGRRHEGNIKTDVKEQQGMAYIGIRLLRKRTGGGDLVNK
jgi:hypothetical protein